VNSVPAGKDCAEFGRFIGVVAALLRTWLKVWVRYVSGSTDLALLDSMSESLSPAPGVL
jgi:hypothetical protein